MKCAGCMDEIEVGDRFIKARPSQFLGTSDDDDALDGIMADLLGGSDGKVAYCEDCTQDGGKWKLETFYGDDDDDDD
jgi:hypothetical protein